MRIGILDVGFDNVTLDEAVSAARGFLAEGGSHCVVTPNPEIVYMCRTDRALAEAVNGADLVLPDGIGIVYASRILGRPLKGKTAGIDFAVRLTAVLAEEGRSLFLLGAKPGIAERAAEALRTANPGLIIAGTADGYFKDDGPVVARINESGAQAVFVCLGAPKQELWMRKNRNALQASLLVGLGGSLDVFAGEASRAPEFMIRLGLEWFYRLLKEPRRIGRMAKLPLFLLAVIAGGRGNDR
ncbi:WecB/TagA/CpsF family glycosyltransferase [Papillibacter cinnamivorans]|uniref:N-acetylglucosaminyldiphosphoundecaprenol N-acetyl-beta-D-mannosaminyltransferase n=1 Tax=Papillibacter cinnamivorans DSM 12816 TaxID=1122930 RepID=A0A1W1ZIH9_9FIRM|nr:WecB/TagA/CpsF family glycosyltransferase [Papillibacter cinnamivorans]SMC47848.1 N-acetylglucosaminyldiphosphoundecaprenol N-acetyl-beta-D-mannosaminyltransferase [Papillibacter cinnamivorans DSM 12816]